MAKLKSKFMNLTFRTEEECRFFFEKLYSVGSLRVLTSCADIAKKGRLSGQEDSLRVHYTIRHHLEKACTIIQGLLPVDYGRFLIPLNSCHRDPFTVVQGKVDYPDLTTIYGHHSGMAIDVDFKTFEEDTGLPRVILYRALREAGFENTELKDDTEELWLTQPWEYWHFSVRV